MAPRDILSITHLLGWTFSHQRAAQRVALEPFGRKSYASPQAPLHYGVFAHRNPVP